MNNIKTLIEREFDAFFEFDTDNRDIVTSTSAKLFAEHVVGMVGSAGTPKGWNLVPVEPTTDMLLAPLRSGRFENRMDLRADIWAAMLAAAPEPPAVQGGDGLSLREAVCDFLRRVSFANGWWQASCDDVDQLESVLRATPADQNSPAVQEEPAAWLHVCRKKPELRTPSLYYDRPSLRALGYQPQPLYAAPQPAEQQPFEPSLASEAAKHLTNWLEMDLCECEYGHSCGYNDVKRTRDALLVAAEHQPAPDASALVEALEDAAQSLATISTGAGRDEFMAGIPDVRSYAKSRAGVAREALAAHRQQGGGE